MQRHTYIVASLIYDLGIMNSGSYFTVLKSKFISCYTNLMTIQQIYKKYRITPSLQLHQYRVAAVAKYLSDKIKQANDQQKEIVMACLLHDMGNIIKFNMDLFPEFFLPEGVEYWKKVKEDFVNKYGSDEHVATIEIAKEVLNSPRHAEFVSASGEEKIPKRVRDDGIDTHRVIELIDAIGFSNARRNAEGSDFGWKIAAYSDMRVEPYGVTTLESRLADGNKRFKLNKPGVSRHDFFVEMSGYLHTIQDQLFTELPFSPESITEETVQQMIRSLGQTRIS